MAARVLVGTSGFGYVAWRGSFYPEDLPARRMLEFYATVLGTVEINYTFRRMPTPALLTGWARQTPPGFRFALKAPQRITHVLRLRDAGEITSAFCTTATRLGPKLGPLLFQLPPYFRFDAGRLADFLAAPSSSGTRAGSWTRPTRCSTSIAPRSASRTGKGS